MKFEKDLGKTANKDKYNRLKQDSNYTEVEYNEKGGVKAIHKDHTFHPKKGHYEKEAQDILFENGEIIVLEKEKGSEGQRFFDGYLNGLKADIKAVEGSGKNNIKNKLNHAESQGAESVILYFPDESLFSLERIHNGLAGFRGQSKYEFKEIIYIVKGKVFRL